MRASAGSLETYSRKAARPAWARASQSSSMPWQFSSIRRIASATAASKVARNSSSLPEKFSYSVLRATPARLTMSLILVAS